MEVKEILALKGAAIVTVPPTATIEALCKVLREKRIGAITVSSDGKKIEGVISERDIAYGLAEHGAKLHAMLVSALMTKDVITCAPKDSTALVASTMLSRRIRHIPVEENGSVAGMVSIRDVLGSQLVDLQQQTAQLRKFLHEADRPPQDRE